MKARPQSAPAKLEPTKLNQVKLFESKRQRKSAKTRCKKSNKKVNPFLENQHERTATVKMESKLFNKVRFLQRNGLMQRRYNYEIDTFQKSTPLLLHSYIALAVKIWLPMKLTISMLFDRASVAQLFVGNPFKYVKFSCLTFFKMV